MASEHANARAQVLGRLRRSLDTERQLFRQPSNGALPDPPMTVFPPSANQSLVESFCAKLVELSGSCDVLRPGTDIVEQMSLQIAKWGSRDDSSGSEVLSWAPDELRVTNLEQRLADAGISLFAPDDLQEQSARTRAAGLNVGITGVAAAFANTGSFVLTPGAGRSRAAGLLPLNHLVLVPLSRLYTTFEAWLQAMRQTGRLQALMRDSGQIAFVSGPSKSADIELNLTLGVHGPKRIHAIVFDDAK